MAAASLSGALARDDHFALAALAAATPRPTVADPGPAFRPRLVPPRAPGRALAALAAANARPTVADPGPAFRPRPPAAPPSFLPAEHLRTACAI